MGFMEAVFYGYAEKFRVGSKIFSKVFVELDLKNGELNIYIPLNSRKEGLIENYNKDKLKKIMTTNIELIDVKIFTPSGKLKATAITDIFIFIKSFNPLPSFHIGESHLINFFNLIPAFSEKPNIYGYTKVCLIPRKSQIEFEIEDIRNNLEKRFVEIVFKNFNLGLPPPVDFGNLYQNFGIVIREIKEGGLLSISCGNFTKDIEDFYQAFKTAFSYLQGRAIDGLLILYGNKLKVLFENSDDKGIFSIIPVSVQGINCVEDFLIRFLNYWKGLNEQEKNIFRRIIFSAVYGKTKQLEVENKLPNLFEVLEIISGGKIEKNKLKTKLNVCLYDAQFMVTLRNEIVHGESIENAIVKSYEKAEKEKDCKGSTFLKLKTLFDKDRFIGIFKIYLALIRIIDLFVLQTIGYSSKWLDPLNEFSESYVNEILLEDEEVLEELKGK